MWKKNAQMNTFSIIPTVLKPQNWGICTDAAVMLVVGNQWEKGVEREK